MTLPRGDVGWSTVCDSISYYKIPERVLVGSIISRNVDTHISREDFSTSTLSRILYYFIIP